MDKWSIKLNSELFFDILLILIWGRNFIVKYARVVLMHLPYISYAAQLIVIAVHLVCVLLAIPYIWKKVRLQDIVAIACIQIFVLMSPVVFPANWDYMESKFLNLFTLVIPLYFVGLALEDEEKIRLIYRVSLVNVGLEILFTVLLRGRMWDSDVIYAGNMHLAYTLLPNVCAILLFAVCRGSILNRVAAAVGAVFIISCGTRGAMLAMMAFVIACFLLLKKHKRPLLTYSGLCAAGLVVWMNLNGIFTSLHKITARLGLSVRIFQKIADGVFWESKGREVIRHILMEAIRKRPLIGYGLGGDKAIAGNYAHNIVIEFLVSFGVIIGPLLLAVIMVIVIRGYRAEKRTLCRGFILLQACTVFMKLMLSGSYLDETCFLFVIGVCIGAIRRRTHEKNSMGMQ